MTKLARPFIAMVFSVALASIAIAQSAGAAGMPPPWFLGIGTTCIMWYFGERAYRKNKGE